MRGAPAVLSLAPRFRATGRVWRDPAIRSQPHTSATPVAARLAPNTPAADPPCTASNDGRARVQSAEWYDRADRQAMLASTVAFGMATPRAHTNRGEDRRVPWRQTPGGTGTADKPDRSVNLRIARARFPALHTLKTVRLQLPAEPSADGVLRKSSPCRIRSQVARGDVVRRT